MTQVQKVEKNTVASFLESKKEEIQKALPNKILTADRMLKIALGELRRNPDLQQCDPMSFCSAVMQSATVGLEPGGVLGQAYLIPFGRECQFIISYKGLVTLTRRSGEISTIYAETVMKGDDFHVTLGTDPSIRHTPKFETNEALFYYAVAKLKDGSTQFQVMSKAQVEYIRQTFSRGKNSSAWTKSYDEMAKKTVLRRLIKMLPISVETAEALTKDNDTFETESTEVVDVDKFKQINASSDIPSDADQEASKKRLQHLFDEAKKLNLNVSDLKVDETLKGSDGKKMVATANVLNERITKASEHKLGD